MRNAKLILPILLLAMAGVGCSSKSSNNADDVAAAPIAPPVGIIPPPPTGNPGGGGSNNGGYGTNNVEFVPVSFAEMNSYVALHPLNAPTGFNVTVDLQADQEGRVYGEVRIGYTDTGVYHEGVFSSGSGVNSPLPSADCVPASEYTTWDGIVGRLKCYPSNGLKEYAYNVWFPGNTQFSGFFQDQYGAIVLVIKGSSTTNQGDGQGGEATLHGEIWYRNFANVTAPQGPERKCWYITSGPYDCRSTPVMTKASLEPSDTYRKLGTFTGLSRSQAFKPYQ